MFQTKQVLTTILALTTTAAFFLSRASRAEEQPSVAEQPRAALSVAVFERRHKELQPPKDELWRSIPWQVSIVEGRELAAKEKKPIFVWVASGKPLGYSPGAPKGKFPLAVAFTLADPHDPLTKLVPDAVRCYADYLR